MLSEKGRENQRCGFWSSAIADSTLDESYGGCFKIIIRFHCFRRISSFCLTASRLQPRPCVGLSPSFAAAGDPNFASSRKLSLQLGLVCSIIISARPVLSYQLFTAQVEQHDSIRRVRCRCDGSFEDGHLGAYPAVSPTRLICDHVPETPSRTMVSSCSPAGIRPLFSVGPSRAVSALSSRLVGIAVLIRENIVMMQCIS